MAKITPRTKPKRKTLKLISLILTWVTIDLALIFGGFVLGMIYEQVLITQQAAYVLRTTDMQLNINFNATEFANELNKTFVPAFKSALNETITKQQQLSNGTTTTGKTTKEAV